MSRMDWAELIVQQGSLQMSATVSWHHQQMMCAVVVSIPSSCSCCGGVHNAATVVPYPSSENCSVTLSVLILMELSTCNSLLSIHFRLLASLSGAFLLLVDSGQQTLVIIRVELETSHGKMCTEAALMETHMPLTCLFKDITSLLEH
jgi:hypothetical protein